MPLQLLGEQNPTLFLAITVMYALFFLVFALGGTRIQVRVWLLQIGDFVRQIEEWSEEGRRVAIMAVREFGVGDRDVARFVEGLLDFVFIEPVERDPLGVLKRLDHLLDVRMRRFRGLIEEVASRADKESVANLEMVLEAASALRQLFFILRHYYLMSKESGNIALVSQIQVMLPFITKIASAYREALNAFYYGKPIGDGAGALVASLLARELGEGDFRDFNGELVRADARYKGREIVILRAKGPGGRVGKPGDGVLQVLKEKKGKVKRVIMIDAGLKFEGEETGKVVEGVGAAIGGPGVDKYKIEVGVVERDVAVDAVVIKMSLEEALTPMKREIVKGVKEAKEKIKGIIERFTDEEDAVIVVGVGNCIGIGN
ncbi:MAG: DUF1512 domain-containing protein [Candidatus Jordarchaeales archaeon]|nr:DUF1512 domain-containing protein [Candidatus Jordarchaeia archaeon]